jgi:hypothetical protein
MVACLEAVLIGAISTENGRLAWAALDNKLDKHILSSYYHV